MVLGKLPGPGRPTNLDIVGQGPALRETSRYRLKYCLSKGR